MNEILKFSSRLIDGMNIIHETCSLCVCINSTVLPVIFPAKRRIYSYIQTELEHKHFEIELNKASEVLFIYNRNNDFYHVMC